MAWEMVNYSCGHSERQQFYGKQCERDSKKAWMERNVCPECWKIQQREKQKNTPITGKIITSAFGAIAGKLVIVLTTGDTYSCKEELKKRGCFFSEYPLDMLGTKTAKAWMYKLASAEEMKTMTYDYLQEKINFAYFMLGDIVTDIEVSKNMLNFELVNKLYWSKKDEKSDRN